MTISIDKPDASGDNNKSICPGVPGIKTPAESSGSVRTGEALFIVVQGLLPILQRSEITSRFEPKYRRKAREQQDNG